MMATTAAAAAISQRVPLGLDRCGGSVSSLVGGGGVGTAQLASSSRAACSSHDSRSDVLEACGAWLVACGAWLVGGGAWLVACGAWPVGGGAAVVSLGGGVANCAVMS